MKYISFSFDDGRIDTFEVAMPIMQRFSMTGAVNVISSFSLYPDQYRLNSYTDVMTPNQIKEWQKNGGEIASHGATHKNSDVDILESIKQLKGIGIDINGIGFVSPESYLTEENMDSSGIGSLLDSQKVCYLRSGIQISREGLWYTFLSVTEMFFHSKFLFWRLNYKNIVKSKQRLYPSIAVKSYTTLKQLKYLINKLKDNEGLIIMFHSILYRGAPGYGKDYYYWDAERFSEFCEWLSKRGDVTILNPRDLVFAFESRKNGITNLDY